MPCMYTVMAVVGCGLGQACDRAREQVPIRAPVGKRIFGLGQAQGLRLADFHVAPFGHCLLQVDAVACGEAL